MNCTSNKKDMTIHLIVGLIKKILYKKLVNTFLGRLKVLEGILMLKLSFKLCN